MRTAYGKGLTRRRIVPVHILRNSLIPVVTYLGADFGSLMVGATVTEGIFNVPGVGSTLYQAIIRGEGPTVVSFVTVMVLIYLVVNLLVDLLYAVLDPRIRYVEITLTRSCRADHFVAAARGDARSSPSTRSTSRREAARNLWIDAWRRACRSARCSGSRPC